MPMITINKKDMLQAIIVEPAWYRVRILDVGEKTAKSGKSQNYPVEGEILFNADNGNTQFAGVPTPRGWLFNEGAISFAIPFLGACGLDEDQLKEAVMSGKGRFDLDDAKGKEIDVFIGNGLWEGRTVNEIKHQYRRPNPDVVAKG